MKSLFIASVSVLASLSAMAQASREPDLQAAANFCELYTDDFALVQTGYRGSGHHEMLTHLVTRPHDSVVGVGLMTSFHEKTTKNVYDDNGVVIGITNAERDAVEFTPAVLKEGRWEVVFQTSWNQFGNDVGERTLRNFAYFVDLQVGSQLQRLWLKAGSRDFTLDDISKDRFFYSPSEFLGGYSSGEYLWRDSGSPLFSSRLQCGPH
jgi:hypothetical protein